MSRDKRDYVTDRRRWLRNGRGRRRRRKYRDKRRRRIRKNRLMKNNISREEYFMRR